MAPEPLLYAVKLSSTRQQKFFFIENGLITITGNKDSLYKASVKGSVTQNVYNTFYEKEWKPVRDSAGGIYRRLDIAEKAAKANNTKMDSVTRQGFDNEFAGLEKFNDTIIFTFVRKNLSSVAAAAVIYDRYISYPYPEKAGILYNLLTDKVKNSSYGKMIKEAVDLNAKTGIGKVIPVFTQADTSGKPVSINNFKGRYVLVDFWASWCAPCRKENPNVVAAYNKYHSKGFDIVSVSLDDNKDNWLHAIAADKLTWTHVSDLKGWKNEVAQLFGIKSVPTSFLIDKNGIIIAKNLRGEALNKKLDEILN
jgi:thiol-disulfide isomerase/thioredoxin